MSGIEVKDYFADGAVDLQDPTDPEETVERVFMDKLARTLTKAEEVVAAGDSDIGIMSFMNLRGDLLDLLDDPEVQTWLKRMRESSRCPFRRFTVG